MPLRRRDGRDRETERGADLRDLSRAGAGDAAGAAEVLITAAEARIRECFRVRDRRWLREMYENGRGFMK